MQAAFRAISSPRRREILRLVWDAEMSSGDIASRLGVSWPLASQNLRVLKQTGLVVERREGKRRLYRANQVALGPLAAVLREMWAEGLERLAELAEDEEGVDERTKRKA